MMELSKERIMVVEDWLQQAERDYKATLLLGADEDSGVFDQACFHCQQAVEKFLKALIISREGDFKKIHDLSELSKDVESLGVPIGSVLSNEDMKTLNPYYVGGRYPGDRALTYEDAQEATKIVEKVKRFVEHEAGLEGVDFDKSWWESV